MSPPTSDLAMDFASDEMTAWTAARKMGGTNFRMDHHDTDISSEASMALSVHIGLLSEARATASVLG